VRELDVPPQCRQILLFLALLVAGGRAAAQAPVEDEVGARLRFLESRLQREAVEARWYEAGWSIVYVGGAGYGAYEICHATSGAALAEGIVTTTKAVIGAATMAINPLKTARGTRELDEGGAAAGQGLDRRLVLAESLLLRNAREADVRYKWQAHVYSLVLNLVGGAIVWAAGDVRRAAQSTGLAVAFGELSIWTRPWRAKRDLRRYREQFGGLASEAGRPVAVRAGWRVAATGFGVSF
jgi:hypothetical protein